MKKLLLFMLIFAWMANAQIVNIPDANFKAKLLSASPSYQIASTNTPYTNGLVSNYHKIDINNDGEIQVSEALLIKYLNVSSSNISNLTGIEAFSNLVYLDCSQNQLTTLNVTQNTDLETLRCYNNQLTTLNVTQNTNLQDLRCYNNQLTNIVTQNTNLEYLRCDNNQLTTLDVTQNTNLQHLICGDNQLTTLNVTQNTNLQYLYCYENQLNALDVTQNTNLLSLLCQDNQLTSIFMKNNQIFSNNNINFNNNYNLQYICCDEMELNFIQSKVNSYGYTNCSVNSYCSFVPGGTYYTIEGQNKLDTNNNGCDSNDGVLPSLKYNITIGTNNGNIISNATGNYSIPVQNGTYTITPILENPAYFTVSPADVTVTFPATASPLVQNFCVTPIGVHHDVEVTIIPTSPARPGFNATYKIIYKNKGNQIENGNITVNYSTNSNVMQYQTSSPTVANSTATELTWNYNNLQPFETRVITFSMLLNAPTATPPLNGGDFLGLDAIITPIVGDEYSADNHSQIIQLVVNSYDPNDKTCVEGTTITPSMVGEYVHYVIRFENTGTYPAENIVVKDMIDLAKFDINTLIPIHSSHNFVTRINGNKVEFIFEGINLPFDDATNDGYIAFKIKTKSNLVVGDSFSNLANIYFDYNFPIVTNNYTTTIAVLSTTDFDFENHFSLYPNPVKDALNFQSKDNTTINSIEIYNSLGQIVLAVPNAISTIDVSSLSSGNYFVKVNTDFGSKVVKIMKE